MRPMARLTPAVVRSLDILELFLEGPTSLSAADVLRATELPRSTVHELLTTLAARGYLNPAGYLEERADINFVKRLPGWANEAKPFPDEIEALRAFRVDSVPERGLASHAVTDPDLLIPRSRYGVRPAYRFGWTELPPLDLSEYT